MPSHFQYTRPVPKCGVAQNLWNESDAAGLSPLALLAYRSRLLASDRTLVNIFGGNTSTKSIERDHLGREARVLWVKGSGSDMAACTEASFAGLRLDEVSSLLGRESMADEEMTAFLERCAFEPGRPRQSIETLLHGFLPFAHVDHTHPDAIISIASARNGQEFAKKVFGERMVWVYYIRPGFELSKKIATAIAKNPNAQCVIMAKHGLITWGGTACECYANTVAIVSEAEEALASIEKSTWIGEDDSKETDLYEMLPILRGAVSKSRRQVLKLNNSKRIVSAASSESARELFSRGAACPDHLVHVKNRPLYLHDMKPETIKRETDKYRSDYENYFNRYAAGEMSMSDASPRVVVCKGVGAMTAGRDETAADVTAQLFERAVEVIEGAEALGGFEPLTEKEAFDIEYWPLELYKLSLRPPERELAGQIALVTGGASGIGRATAALLHERGAHVCIADLNDDGAREAADSLGGRAFGAGCDVTDEKSVAEAFRECVMRWGGLDIVVCSAGIASSSPIEETSEKEWEGNFSVLAKGYFLCSREAFKIWKRQGIGGSLVYVVSKNAVAAGKNAAAYSSAKAAELHLARCLAEEGGAHGIRVNSVLPDAVLEGSAIWSGGWRAQRAKAYGIAPEELDEFYRKRTTLQRSVLPEDVARAVFFFAGPASEKTTGAALTVDAGVPSAYLR